MIVACTGDLLSAEAEVLVNPVNCVGIMGAGLALDFKLRYPQVFQRYRAACKNGEIQVGSVVVHLLSPAERQGSVVRAVVSFPTKHHWRESSKITSIETGLHALVHALRNLQAPSVAVPALGCGKGNLNWDDVRPRVERAFAAAPDIRVLLYAPHDDP